jgi:L-ascorbate metabolism protein UlaG (beta-lactamase superfamily)
VTTSVTKKASIVVKWLDHSSFMIKAAGKTIYIDPYAGEYVDKAGLILVTHSHSDHMNTTWIGKVRRDDTVIVAPADCVAKIGGTVKSLKPGEKMTVGEIVVEAVEAYNFKRFRSPGNPYHPKGFGVGYLLSTGGKTIYHAGDTDFIPEMKGLKNIHLALLPCDGTFNMNSSEVVEATLAIRPKFLIPMHLRNTDPSIIKKEVEAKSEIKVLLLKPGEVFEIG